ncbi:MAG: GNAT family N-acetyltransferase [Acinetobacter sp.]
MLIEHQQQDSQGQWFVEPNEKRLAEMSYSRKDPDRLVIEHTWVDDSLRGQHVGHYLVEAAVKFAREQGVKIIPECPFAKSVFERDPAFSDVLSN